MQDWYQMPVLVLTALLLPAFGYLYARTRDVRNLLWFLAFCAPWRAWPALYPSHLGHGVHQRPVGRGCGRVARHSGRGAVPRLSLAPFFPHRQAQGSVRHSFHGAVDDLCGAVLRALPSQIAPESHVLGVPGAGHDFAGYRRSLGPRQGNAALVDGHPRFPACSAGWPIGSISRPGRIGR